MEGGRFGNGSYIGSGTFTSKAMSLPGQTNRATYDIKKTQLYREIEEPNRIWKPAKVRGYSTHKKHLEGIPNEFVRLPPQLQVWSRVTLIKEAYEEAYEEANEEAYELLVNGWDTNAVFVVGQALCTDYAIHRVVTLNKSIFSEIAVPAMEEYNNQNLPSYLSTLGLIYIHCWYKFFNYAKHVLIITSDQLTIYMVNHNY